MCETLFSKVTATDQIAEKAIRIANDGESHQLRWWDLRHPIRAAALPFRQAARRLLKLESAVEALVWIFHQQEEKREQTRKRSSDDSNKYRPERHGSFDNASGVASNTSHRRDDRARRRLWRSLIG